LRPSRNLSKFLLALLAVVAALSLAACGSDGDTTTVTETTGESVAAPEDVTRSFLLALANGDGPGACSYTSAAAIEEIEAQGPCEEAVVAAVGEATEEDIAQVEDATYEVGEQTDTTASVTATRPDGSAETFSLVLEDGEWKVDG
jgi:hypothetical protein